MEREWESEPNRKEWEHVGLKCLVLRAQHLGHLNGYVGVPEGHPAYDRDYNEIDVEVHGGLTFGDFGDGQLRPKGFYWLGFDCAHLGDFVPGQEKHGRADGTYRNMVYVTAETEKLAEQLVAYKED